MSQEQPIYTHGLTDARGFYKLDSSELGAFVRDGPSEKTSSSPPARGVSTWKPIFARSRVFSLDSP